MEYLLATFGVGFILLLATKIFNGKSPKIKKAHKGDYIIDGKDSDEKIDQKRK